MPNSLTWGCPISGVVGGTPIPRGVPSLSEFPSKIDWGSQIFGDAGFPVVVSYAT